MKLRILRLIVPFAALAATAAIPAVANAMPLQIPPVAAHAERGFQLHITIHREPPRFSNDSTPRFRFGRNVHFNVKDQACRIDSRPWVHGCSSPYQAPSFHDGRHTFTVRLRMTDGRVASDSYAWKIDTVAAAAPILSGGTSTWAGNASQTLTWSSVADNHGGSGVAGYDWRVSADHGITWTSAGTSAAGSASRPVTAQGDLLYEVRSADRGGNLSAWSASVETMLDHTGPTAPTTVGGTGTGTWATSVPVNVSSLMDSTDSGGSGVDSYQYRESFDDGATWQPTVSPANGDDVTRDGVTWVEFSAVDDVGNASDWSAPEIVQIRQSVPPAAPTGLSVGYFSPPGWKIADLNWNAVDPGAGSPITQYNVRASWDGIDNYTFTDHSYQGSTEYQLANNLCSLVGPGPYHVEVQAQNADGLTSPWSDAVEVNVCS